MNRMGRDHISFEPDFNYNIGAGAGGSGGGGGGGGITTGTTSSPSPAFLEGSRGMRHHPQQQGRSPMPPPIPPKKAPLSSYRRIGSNQQGPQHLASPPPQPHLSPQLEQPQQLEPDAEFPWEELEDLRRLHEVFDTTIGDLVAAQEELESTRRHLAQKEADAAQLAVENRRLALRQPQDDTLHSVGSFSSGSGGGGGGDTEVRDLKQQILLLTSDLEDSRHEMTRLEKKFKHQKQDWDDERERLEKKVGPGAETQLKVADLTRQLREAEERVTILDQEKRGLVEKTRILEEKTRVETERETSSSGEMAGRIRDLKGSVEFYRNNSERVGRENEELREENRRLVAVAGRSR
ncbi:hypothetical protein MKZ38_004700 [Zalerion maritima]|uniref:Uncharacterized protein n=1 Tax=Zalerion maritima TaxID=339359 RepID=A0AAD5RM79_9PEZI|nr:hypothetical protein MKZ38_004700 [Zalerion maritima]